MGILDTKIITISEYLQNKDLSIPHFQRPYKWSTKNVNQLLDDIQRFKGDAPYRIGTIVIYKENDTFQIVDGQQRTITFLLIFKALCSYKLETIQNESLKIIINKIYKNAFQPKFKNTISKHNIRENYFEIERRIATFDENDIHFFLNKCQITYFVIDDVSEAFQFFDSQNARGKDLEPHDLLKAFHLRELENDSRQLNQKQKEDLVKTWEEMDTKELAQLFSDFMYRVRGWSKGNSSRYFTKKDSYLFKGFTLSSIDNYPYVNMYRLLDEHIKNIQTKNNTEIQFPFQLDQTIINGKYFFDMVSHYKKIYTEFEKNISNLSINAKQIMEVIDTYEGKNRTGDKYVRMLFNSALLYYIDKFGTSQLSKAIEKIFIWAYSLRLNYESLQLASVDNYVIQENNLFKKIRDAIYQDEILNINLPQLKDIHSTKAVSDIIDLFTKLKYLKN